MSYFFFWEFVLIVENWRDYLQGHIKFETTILVSIYSVTSQAPALQNTNFRDSTSCT